MSRQCPGANACFVLAEKARSPSLAYMEDSAAIGRQLQADRAASYRQTAPGRQCSIGRLLQADSAAIGRKLPWQSFLNRNHIGKVCVFCVLRVDSENVVPPPKLRFIHVQNPRAQPPTPGIF